VKCPQCEEKLTYNSAYGESRTLVGYYSGEDGHNHDDNCIIRYYKCKNGHNIKLSIRRTCSKKGCEWKGSDECFCHEGKKIDRWP